MPGGAAPAAGEAAPAGGAAKEEKKAKEDKSKADGGAAWPKEEPKKVAKVKEIVNLKLVSFDDANKIKVLKEVRAILELGLKECKEFVESVPKMMKKQIPNAEADEIIWKLEAVGAKCEKE